MLGGEKEKKMKKRYIVIPIVILAMLAVFSTPAMAGVNLPCTCDVTTDSSGDPCGYGFGGTVENGTVYVGGGRPADLYNPYMEFDVPSGNIKWARVYWHIWGGNPQSDGWTHATFCNANEQCFPNSQYIREFEGGCHEPGNRCNRTSDGGFYMGGCGTHWVYWNVTDEVTNGYNNITVDNSDWWDGRSFWVYLVVALDDMPDYPETLPGTTYYWINQGYVDLPSGSTSTTWFNGPINTTVNHTLWHLALTSNEPNRKWFNDVHLVEDYPGGAWENAKSKLIPAGWIDTDQTQNLIWDNYGDPWLHPVMGILIGNEYLYLKPDLTVGGELIIDLNDTNCPDQTPIGYVVNHEYDVKAKICNIGGASTGSSFDVTLDDNGTVQTNTMAPLGGGECQWTTFQWTPTTDGMHTLNVSADSGGVIEEDREDNNEGSWDRNVLPAGASNVIPTAIEFSPAWQCNKTEIIVNVSNEGTGDATNFDLTVTMSNESGVIWTDTTQRSLCAMAYKNFITPIETAPELTRNSNYTVEARTNPAIEKAFQAIEVSVKMTHHYGNCSDYNGQNSNYNTAKMFETTKIVTNYTTPWTLLTSEADVTTGPAAAGPPYVWGINRTVNKGTSTWYLNESGADTETCPIGEGIWWYCLINGITAKEMPYGIMDNYYFEDGDVMRMDLFKYVNAGNSPIQFRPPAIIMEYPGPFKNGFRDVWDTTIVYPSNDPGGDYLALANAIRDNLLSEGVANVNISTNATLDPDEKKENHLILLGTQFNNDIIDEINGYHTEVGMPVYFNDTNWMIDDWLNDCQPATFDCGGVVEACDNPFNNGNPPWTDTWLSDESQTIWLATGVSDKEAKNAAELLANHTDRFNLKFFWGYTINITIYEGMNLISTPFEMDSETGTDTLAWVFEDNPANGDKVFRYIPGTGYVFATYFSGTWWGAANVEPIEPEVGYQYNRIAGAGNFNLILGCRLPPGTISTMISEDLNLIGYACLNKTTLGTFGNNPVDGDKVFKYIPETGYVFATYFGGTWWGAANVEPIEPGVGYEYHRMVGAGQFSWIYNC
ncbi:MAG TPA: hypothetical protein C5S37_14210 [Methanophagales archaeon]|nr:hypothetical protein [Methanophagales archaeon]